MTTTNQTAAKILKDFFSPSRYRPTTTISKLSGIGVGFLPCLPSLPTAGGPVSVAGK